MPLPLRKLLKVTLALLCVTGVTVFFRVLMRSANTTTVGFTFLLAILAVSSLFGFAEALVASLVATAEYNFYFLPPIGTFTIADPQNWVALGAFLITAMAGSRLSTSARRRAADAEERRLEMARLYEFSRSILLIDQRNVAQDIERSLMSIFHFEDARIETTEPRRLVSTPFNMRWRLQLGQKDLGVLQVKGAPLSGESSEAIAGIVSIALERARMLEEFNRIRVIQESEALKSALLDSVTHDLRTPLTSIKAAATTLLSRPGSSVDRDFLMVINEECDRLNELLQNVLDMARIEGRHLRPALRRQSLLPIIEEAIEYSHVPRSRLQLDVADDLPPVMVDGQLVSRALVQLLANAAAYSPPDTPIELRAFAGDGEVITEVRDRGYGISTELLPRIFEKFVRGERAQQERPEGMGVGLSIARGIIDLQGGRISVNSNPGGGSLFSFSLPAAMETADGNANSGGR